MNNCTCQLKYVNIDCLVHGTPKGWRRKNFIKRKDRVDE